MVRSHVRRPRRGLTLVELIVVMAILVALAAIVIPLLPGVLGRAETSARATNQSEIYKWIQTYEATTSSYPQDWDALVDKSGTPINYLVTSNPALFAGAAPTTGQVAALTGAGIRRLQQMYPDYTTAPATFSATFNPYETTDRSTTGDGFAPATSINLIQVQPQGLVDLNLADNTTNPPVVCFAFGLGKRTSFIGAPAGIASAPYNFYDNQGISPTTTYGRFLVIFKVSTVTYSGTPATATNTDLARAELVGVTRVQQGHLKTIDDDINQYFQDVQTNSGS